MITLVEALNYRCLRYIRQPLDRFHVLVGPNGSGKSTFFDVVRFVSELMYEGLEATCHKRGSVTDLFFGGEGDRIEIAVEGNVPERHRLQLGPILTEIAERPEPSEVVQDLSVDEHVVPQAIARYVIGIEYNRTENLVEIDSEALCILHRPLNQSPHRQMFPDMTPIPANLASCNPNDVIIASFHRDADGSKIIRYPSRNVTVNLPAYRPRADRVGWPLIVDPQLLVERTWYPVSSWFAEMLGGIQTIVLDSAQLRAASPPGYSRSMKPDGSNLPWVVERFKEQNSERYNDWIAHLRTALPDLRDVRVVHREDDRHAYLMVSYDNGLEVPSWGMSDGSLRLFVLTLIAYLPDTEGIYLVEEPENGIHPRAIETMFQSLASVYDAQVMLATHSPMILGIAEPEQVLCFAKNEEGATDIVRGDLHPMLADWRHDVDLGTLFASGVLG
jgi:predicted ATPase